MARGFVAGGMYFGLVGLASCIASGLIPMWLVSQTSLVHSFCWLGEGIWSTSFRWGNDIPEIHLECDTSTGHYTTTEDAYCRNTPTSIPMSPSFKEDMCSATNAAKLFVVLSCCAAIVSLFFGYMSHLISRFRYQIYFSGLATLCSFVALMCGIVVNVVMITSPLYHQEHFQALSQNFKPNFKGISCVFEYPSMNSYREHRNLDGPMHCVFPGPSFALALAGLVGNLFSTGFFALKLRECFLIREMTLHHEEELFLEHSHDPYFGSRLSPQHSVCFVPSTGGNSVGQLFSPDIGIPTRFKFDRHYRHYSLYGAVVRHFSHRSWLTRHVITLIPLLCNFAHAFVIAFWMFNGTVFGLSLQSDQVPKLGHRHHHLHHHHSMVNDQFDTLLSSAMEYNNVTDDDLSGLFNHHKNFTLLEQIIEYSPVTTMHVFLKNGNYFFCAVQMVSTFLWPMTKSLLWAWLWYTPADEVFRGRLFSWIDALGKVNLANLFIMVTMTLANSFYREMFIPWKKMPLLIDPHHYMRLRIRCGIHVGPGTYGYVLAFAISLLLGEAYLAIHRYAKQWEESRREEEEAKFVNQQRSLQNEMEEEDEDELRGDDTPYWMMQENHHSREVQAKERLRRANERLINAGDGGEEHEAETAISIDHQDVAHVPDTAIANATEVAEAEMVIPAEDATQPLLSASSSQQTAGEHREDSQDDSFVLEDHILNAQVHYSMKLKTEALCDHIFLPMHGKFYSCTFFGKALMTLFCLVTFSSVLVAQSSTIYAISRSGFIGEKVIAPSERVVNVSVYSLPYELQESGVFGDTPVSLVTAVVVFVIIMPILHVFGLLVMWLMPMSSRAQLNYIHAMEIASSWSALDMFALVGLGMSLDLHTFFAGLLEAAGIEPLNQFIRKHFDDIDTFASEQEDLVFGFWYIALAVVLEKTLEHIIQIPFATMISERAGTQDIAKRASELQNDVRRNVPHRTLTVDMIRDNLEVLSPAARYVTGSSKTEYFYAGQPIFTWRLLAFFRVIEEDFTFSGLSLDNDGDQPGFNLNTATL